MKRVKPPVMFVKHITPYLIMQQSGPTPAQIAPDAVKTFITENALKLELGDRLNRALLSKNLIIKWMARYLLRKT